MKIEWKPGWEEELQRALQPAMQQFAEDHQAEMDALSEQYAGQPVADVAVAVRQMMDRWPGKLSSEDELTRIATAISQGQRVLLRGGPQ
ncbi:hypothetical protein H7K45_20765 [Mycobacterium yunnanensis]|uniref:Uncharacterized protein n=1 Tax=Mycobacterium yunnanensis TaxID=368477 RepID=A0A9X3BUR5_9MYCO|nr:hypothetical protein [Mycobacterium yunnanensis]MCV7422989.1 hypothetical protein [Mycobacterium yunnanensis]